MSDDEWVDVAPNAALLVPEWSCADTFKAGRMFLNMTYAEVYESVQKLHVAVGGVHLDVQCRPFGKASTDALPGIVKFYCPHSRDHKDQKGSHSTKKKLNSVTRIVTFCIIRGCKGKYRREKALGQRCGG